MVSCLHKDMGTPDANSKSGIPYCTRRASVIALSTSLAGANDPRPTAHGGCFNLPGSRAFFSGVA